MSWIPLKMRFPGTCLECGKRVAIGEPGLWKKGTGVKHAACAPEEGPAAGPAPGGPRELRCAVCGGPAGCPACEHADACDTEAVSQLCMCKKCMDADDPASLYLESVAKRSPALGPARRAPGQSRLA